MLNTLLFSRLKPKKKSPGLSLQLYVTQCWTVGAIFTFGRGRMFGPEKLRPLAVDRSRSRRIKNCKTCVIKVLISNH